MLPSPLLRVSLLLLCLRTQGRAFIDRNPDLFSYVLDHLRNGGTLPPLPKDDELLVERTRREFDYFCVIPNPVDDARTWVEKLRDGDYIAEIVEVCAPLISFFPFSKPSPPPPPPPPARLSIAAIRACAKRMHTRGANSFPPPLAQVKWPGDSRRSGQSPDITVSEDCQWAAFNYHDALFAANLCTSDPTHELVRVDEGSEGIFGLSICGHELAFCCTPNEVRYVDIRKDCTDSHIQTLTVEEGEHNCVFERTTAAHVAAVCFDCEVTVVWDRATGQCIYDYDNWSLVGLCGSRLVLRWGSEPGEVSFGISDLHTPDEDNVDLLNQPEHITQDDVLLISGAQLFHWHSTQSTKRNAPFDSITVYSVESGDVVRQMALSEPVPYFSVPDDFFQGRFVILQERKQTQLNHIRCIDIETGVVRRMRLGFCEGFNEVWASADGKRVVAKRTHVIGGTCTRHNFSASGAFWSRAPIIYRHMIIYTKYASIGSGAEGCPHSKNLNGRTIVSAVFTLCPRP